MSDHEKKTTDIIPATVRSWLYGVALAVIPILAAYGLVSDQMAPLWAAFIAAVLSTGTSFAYRPTRTPKEVE